MKVVISTVGSFPRIDIIWPENWPVPAVDSQIWVDAGFYWVRSVSYYPHGEQDSEPFVYVVVGPRKTEF